MDADKPVHLQPNDVVIGRTIIQVQVPLGAGAKDVQRRIHEALTGKRKSARRKPSIGKLINSLNSLRAVAAPALLDRAAGAAPPQSI